MSAERLQPSTTDRCPVVIEICRLMKSALILYCLLFNFLNALGLLSFSKFPLSMFYAESAATANNIGLTSMPNSKEKHIHVQTNKLLTCISSCLQMVSNFLQIFET